MAPRELATLLSRRGITRASYKLFNVYLSLVVDRSSRVLGPDREQEVSRPGSVAIGKCPDREVSNREVSRPGSVLDREVSRPGSVPTGKCPTGMCSDTPQALKRLGVAPRLKLLTKRVCCAVVCCAGVCCAGMCCARVCCAGVCRHSKDPEALSIPNFVKV